MSLRTLVGLLLLLAAAANTAHAQPGRSFGRSGGVFDLIRTERVRQDLKFTEGELAEIAKIEAEGVPNQFQLIKPVAEENPDADGDTLRRLAAEREQAEWRKAEDRVAELLGGDRAERLRRHLWEEAGPNALTRHDVAEYLELDEPTRTRLAELDAEYQSARRSFGRRPSDEERAELRTEWQEKFAAALTAEQRKKWASASVRSDAKSTEATGELTAELDQPNDENSATENAQPTPDPAQPTTKSNPSPAAPRTARVADGGSPLATFEPSGNRARDPKAPFSFNFRNAPWDDVLELFAEQANLTLDPEVVPPGEFNYIDRKSFNATEALDVLNGYLLPKGFVLVRRDDFLVCVDLQGEIPPNMVPNVTVEELSKRGRNELVSVVIPLSGENADPGRTAEEVKAVLGAYGKADPLSVAKAIVVRDTAGNAARIARWLTNIDDVDLQALEFKRFVLENIAATEAEPIIREQLGVGTGVRNVSIGGSYRSSSLGNGGPPGTAFVQSGRGGSDDDRRRMFYEMMKRRREEEERRRDDGRSSSSRSSSSSSSGKVQISVDPRTNALLMTASRLQLMLAEKIIEAIDVPPDGAYEPIESSGPYLRVYKVDNADAGEVAKTITAIHEGIVVNEDRSADTIHIWGDDEVQREAATLIRELDGLGSTQQVSVIPLARMDPLAATTMIRSMFLKDGENAPTVEADLYGRRLVVRASLPQITQIKSMLAQLGEDGNPESRFSATGTGRVRQLSLSGRDPDELLPLIEKLWNASNDQSVRIVPNNRPAVRRRYPESSDRSLEPRELRGTRPSESERSEAPTTPSEEADDSTDAVLPEDGDDVNTTLQPISVQDTAPPKPDGDATSSKGIAITPSGDGLVIVSDDEEALDRLEVFVDTLTRAVPPATQWNVFYLRTADATETATMLEQLIPSASVSSSLSTADQGMLGSLTSGITSMGSSLMELSGLENAMITTNTLRIVPDIRSNSLFVAGPPQSVDMVEELLDVLDEDELPDSLRDRRPGTIPVEYADVDDVADIVREVYRDYMVDTRQQQGGRGANPLQMLMQQGGNQRSGRGRQQSDDARLTLSVDNRTSQLIVSANDALFREIQALVTRLDEDARLAKPTTRIVPLQYADTIVVQNALTSLIPKVHVGGTPSRRPSPQPSQPQAGDRDRGGDGDRDAMRQFFEQRMRERMQGGGQRPPGANGGAFPGGPRGDSRGGDFRGPRGGADGGGRRGRG